MCTVSISLASQSKPSTMDSRPILYGSCFVVSSLTLGKVVCCVRRELMIGVRVCAYKEQTETDVPSSCGGAVHHSLSTTNNFDVRIHHEIEQGSAEN